MFLQCLKANSPVFSVGKAPSPGSSAVSEKVRTRLEELDDLEEVGFRLRPHGHTQICINTPAYVHKVVSKRCGYIRVTSFRWEGSFKKVSLSL